MSNIVKSKDCSDNVLCCVCSNVLEGNNKLGLCYKCMENRKKREEMEKIAFQLCGYSDLRDLLNDYLLIALDMLDSHTARLNYEFIKGFGRFGNIRKKNKIHI